MKIVKKLISTHGTELGKNDTGKSEKFGVAELLSAEVSITTNLQLT